MLVKANKFSGDQLKKTEKRKVSTVRLPGRQKPVSTRGKNPTNHYRIWNQVPFRFSSSWVWLGSTTGKETLVQH